ncbi:MAG: hypothetical protein JWR20_719 [Marmoricola sp.]|nr:hypothetical protein [Marmoricola sp.]
MSVLPGRPDRPARLGAGAGLVATLFGVSGVVHLVRPSVFESMVPGLLGDPTPVVVVSGVAELVCAAGLVWPRTRRLAGPASAALLVAILPANVTMAVDAWQGWRSGEDGAAWLAGTLVRLPLQAPLVWWAWRAGRGGATDRVVPT